MSATPGPKPSFLVDPHKNLFYCYGCGRGGDVIRFAELFHQVKFSEAVALLREWCGLAPLLDQVIDFYRVQLFRHHDAVSYLYDRGLRGTEVIEHMRIGYAPGRCLRAWLTELGYPTAVLRRAGLVNAAGKDAFSESFFRWREISTAEAFEVRSDAGRWLPSGTAARAGNAASPAP